MDYEEYLAELKKNTTAVLDGFTSIDERVNYVARKLDGLSNLENSVVGLTNALGKMGVIVSGRTRQIKFQETLAIQTGGRFVDRCPYNCVLTSIGFHFPPGCNGFVDVAAGYANEQCYPTSGYLSLDDCSSVFPTNEMLNYNERLWVEVVNTDLGNPHTITVMFILQERSS